MKRRIARRLADELESGRWKKAKRKLGRGYKCRCCLGVLQEIAPAYLAKANLWEQVPSANVCEWAGLGRREMMELAEQNDSRVGWAWHIEYLRSI